MKNNYIEEFNDDDFIELPLSKEEAKKSLSKEQPKSSSKITQQNTDKRLDRRKQTAEDFTPSFLVNEMLDKLPKTLFTHNQTFCDPACGNGNFLIEVLRRKLNNKHNPLEALQSIYGADIMEDNIKECRLRLLKVLVDNNVKLTIEHIKAVGKNIVCTPLSKYPNGSLDYDFEFSHTVNDFTAQQGLDKIKKEKLLEQVSV